MWPVPRCVSHRGNAVQTDVPCGDEDSQTQRETQRQIGGALSQEFYSQN